MLIYKTLLEQRRQAHPFAISSTLMMKNSKASSFNVHISSSKNFAMQTITTSTGSSTYRAVAVNSNIIHTAARSSYIYRQPSSNQMKLKMMKHNLYSSNFYERHCSHLLPSNVLHRIRSLSTTPPNPSSSSKVLRNTSKKNFNESITNVKKMGNKAKDSFIQWKNSHPALLIAIGATLGAAMTGTAIYFFLSNNPSTIEQLIVDKTVRAFAHALNFEARKKIYFGLPEINFPVPQTPNDFISPPSGNNNNCNIAGGNNNQKNSNLVSWANTVRTISRELDTSWLFTAKTAMREELINEILSFPDFESRLTSIRSVLPSSLERNFIISHQFLERLKEKGFVEGQYLEDNPPMPNPESLSLSTKLLTAAIAFFPGPINKLIMFLNGNIDIDTMVNSLADSLSTQNKPKKNQDGKEETEDDEKKLFKEALEIVLHQFQKLDANRKPGMGSIQQFVLHNALSTTIMALEQHQSQQQQQQQAGQQSSRDPTPYELYVKAIEEDLLGPLRRDARITEDILTQVKKVFLALPSRLQARILLRAIQHPVARGNVTPEQQAQVVRDMLSSGGVVAVKLAQMLAEDPKVPSNYRHMLGGLRDDNEPMPLEAFWWSLPPTIRKQIDFLGPCLGTGSVKQVHVARFQRKTKYNDRAVAALRNYVEDEALASLTALESSDELAPVAKRLARLVFGEFNLFAEGEALAEFALTSIGKHPDFRVVKVIHHSPKCLVEEIAKGPTVGAVLDSSTTSEHLKKKVMQKLVDYHRAVFSAFIEDGLIHSDIHLANAVVQIRDRQILSPKLKKKDDKVVKDPLDDISIGFVLFDVGQMDRIGFADTKALLWVLGAISSIERRVVLRNVALNNLAKVSTIQKTSTNQLNDIARMDTAIPATRLMQRQTSVGYVEVMRKSNGLQNSDNKSNGDLNSNINNNKDNKNQEEIKGTEDQKRAREEAIVRALLEEAFIEAIQPFEDGTLPDQKQAYMLFLRACEKRNVSLPKGAFSVAKMIDGMLSQMQAYKLENVVEEQMEQYLKKHISWTELGSIAAQSLMR